MTSLHHVTHAVCFVVISYLLKKHIELRSQHTELESLHDDLTYRHNNLKRSCHFTEKGRSLESGDDYCQCPCPSDSSFTQFQTDARTDFNTQVRSDRQVQSSAEKGGPSSDLNPSEISVDDFGRTLDNDGVSTSDSSDTEIQVSTASAVFSQTAFSATASHQQAPVIQSSFSFREAALEPSFAQQRHDGRTEQGREAPVNLLSTQESLEKVQPSPSSIFSHTTITPSAEEDSDNSADISVRDESSDFYLGSADAFDRENEEEGDVIVTSAEETLTAGLDPGEFGKDVYEDWEGVQAGGDPEEEKPHPAFGNVPLEWLTDKDVDALLLDGSSVHCEGSTISDRLCHFTNLCMNPQSRKFVFLKGSFSVEDNVPMLKPQDALLELSTVAGHNAQYFSYLTIPVENARDFQIVAVGGTTFVFKRFKPDNIMHVFHDDLIPLFHTLSQDISPLLKNGQDKFPVSLFLADDHSEGEFYDLFASLAANNVFTLESLKASVAKTGKSDSLVCFPEARVGLYKATTWYQYGFFTPQGPIPDSKATSQDIHSVSSVLLRSLGRECPFCREGKHFVLISRKETRRILNEMELVLAISKKFRVKVMTVSLETHDLGDILPIVHSSRGIIGMHGSLLSLAAFLKQGSIVVELFPYAVNPAAYTPYKTLCEIPGMLIAYRAWANPDPDSSVTHPDWLVDVGGIHHLPLQQQMEITSQTEVPSHLCCEDPSWLFHIFQDTHVNVSQVLSLIDSALEETEALHISDRGTSLSVRHPGPVRNLRCIPEHSRLALEWDAPWDVELFHSNKIDYSIVVQSVASMSLVSLDAGNVLKYSVSEGVESGMDYRVWVRCVVDGIQGPFAAVQLCSTKL